MHYTQQTVIHKGQLVLTNLPFADGQPVSVLVSDRKPSAQPRPSIHQVQEMLKGGVIKFDLPFEPMIDEQDWEALK